MVKLSYITEEEDAALKRKRAQKTPVQIEYEEYISNLPENQVGRLDLEKKDKPATVANRLRRAGKSLGIKLKVRKVGNIITFKKI